MKKFLMAAAAALACMATAHAGLNTATYVSHDGGGSGSATGDLSGVGALTLTDAPGGDLWNGGDQFIYVHDSNQTTTDFSAQVRVVSQTAAVDGRWGKAGIHVRNDLNGDAANAMTQVAAGNGSQLAGSDPVPVRIAGRTGNDGNGGFENPIILNPASGLASIGAGEVANDFFHPAPRS